MRRALPPRLDYPATHQPRFQIPPDQFEHPGILHLPCHPRHQDVVVDPVEELLQVDVHHPAPAGLHVPLCLQDRLLSAAPRPEAVARLGEPRFVDRLENLQQRLLDQPVHHRRNAQCPDPARRLGNVHRAHRLRNVLAGQQRRLDARPVHLQPVAQRRHRQGIHPGRAAVADHLPVRQPHVALFDHRLHQRWRLRFRLPNSRRASLRTPIGPRQVPPAFLRCGLHSFVHLGFVGKHRGLSS
ncbi:hypothetical protein FQZ97_959530 [compost metagenome]